MALNIKKDTSEKPKNWYADKYQTTLVQRNIFAVITLVSLLTSLIAVFAVERLAPLKSVEPFVIQVDEKTGITEVVQPRTRDSLDRETREALDNYFAWQYVRARETYDITDQFRSREVVRISSHPDMYREYLREISTNNPLSPPARLGELGKRFVSTPIVTHLRESGKNRVQIRFIVKERIRNEQPFTYHKIATLQYVYVPLELSRDEQFINPLGFQVVSYRLDDATINR